jgi:hypothetical protein
MYNLRQMPSEAKISKYLRYTPAGAIANIQVDVLRNFCKSDPVKCACV